MSSPSPTNQDLEHLRLLSIFHYVYGGINVLFGFLPLLSVGFGVMNAGSIFPAKRHRPVSAGIQRFPPGAPRPRSHKRCQAESSHPSSAGVSAGRAFLLLRRKSRVRITNTRIDRTNTPARMGSRTARTAITNDISSSNVATTQSARPPVVAVDVSRAPTVVN
jgi:hypothetical protein